jgi:carbamoyltransferase
MKVFAVAVNIHDHNTYDGVFHNQVERHNRRKHNLNRENPHDRTHSREFFDEHFVPNYINSTKDDIFAFTVSNLGQEFVLDLLQATLPDTDFLHFYPTNLWDRLHTDSYYYIDHHQSHAAYAFLSSKFKESDILAIDGRGWQFSCIFIDKTGTITNLTEKISIGGLWNRLAQDLGFGYLDAGKVMGLVGYGEYNEEIYVMIHQYLQNPNHKLPNNARDILRRVSKKDVAFTLQHVTIELVKKFIYPLKSSENICIAGGVAYNGYMNEEFTKHYVNVHVPPAAGDEGQSIGTYMHADYVLNDNVHIPTVYSGKEYEVDTGIFQELSYQQKPMEEIYIEVANAIANGAIVGWFQGKSESGNRALGNRSILADPRNPDIKTIINSRIKMREDFRPFAPSVLEEYYKDYFDTNQPSPFMSRIMPVISDKIPGVTHVDGTARIQTVNKEFNHHYYNLINAFYKVTGIPMLLNTSFNCQEPIVETPQDAVNTFKKSGLDLLVIKDYVVKK